MRKIIKEANLKDWMLSKLDNNQLKECNTYITKYHFGEMIDWNIQTAMYSMLKDLISTMDLKYLSDIAEIYKKSGNINDISIQLEDAILDVLISKRLIRTKNKTNKILI